MTVVDSEIIKGAQGYIIKDLDGNIRRRDQTLHFTRTGQTIAIKLYLKAVTWTFRQDQAYVMDQKILRKGVWCGQWRAIQQKRVTYAHPFVVGDGRGS